jgi:hypothetical protein
MKVEDRLLGGKRFKQELHIREDNRSVVQHLPRPGQARILDHRSQHEEKATET